MPQRFLPAAIAAALPLHAASAQTALPSAPSGDVDPFQQLNTILEWGLNGLMALGAGVVIATLAFALIRTMTGGHFDGQRVALAVVSGAGLAGISFIGNLVLGV